jgi:lipoprotein NlpI
MNSEYAEAYFYRAKLYLSKGNKESACLDLKKAYEMDFEGALELMNTECK